MSMDFIQNGVTAYCHMSKWQSYLEDIPEIVTKWWNFCYIMLQCSQTNSLSIPNKCNIRSIWKTWTIGSSIYCELWNRGIKSKEKHDSMSIDNHIDTKCNIVMSIWQFCDNTFIAVTKRTLHLLAGKQDMTKKWYLESDMYVQICSSENSEIPYCNLAN